MAVSVSFLSAFVVVLSVVCFARADPRAELSFAAPFNAVGEMSGSREVTGWTVGGDASVLQHFVRLTSDRQSKRGYLWNASPLPAEFSAILTFRISGQGKTLFGDGLGLWLTTSQWHATGDFHGFKQQFSGIGIVFDTFRNAEVGTLHKDVAVYVNDGRKEQEAMARAVQGCDARIRYHEGRADFSIKNASRALIELQGRTLSIAIDGRNRGEWTDCIKIENLDLPDDWFAGPKYVGLTATTGSLADNHDVLSFKAFDRVNEAKAQAMRPPHLPLQGAVRDELVTMAHFEHSITSLKEGVVNTVNKIKKAEELVEERVQKIENLHLEKFNEQKVDLAQRVTDLEARVAAKVEANVDTKLGSKVDAKVLDQRVSAMETTIHRSIEQRLAALEQIVEGKLATRLANVEKALNARIVDVVGDRVNQSQWFSGILFSVLLFFGGAGFVIVWRKYVWLKKTHII